MSSHDTVQSCVIDFLTYEQDNYKNEKEKDAAEKYKIYKSVDPFDEVKPSLLNHEQILAYIQKTGMISPFRADDLQGITYDARLYGECIYWEYIEDVGFSNDSDIQNIHKRFKKKIVYVRGDPDDLQNPEREIIIKPNSIVFVTLEPTFRIPDYIVLRYNFRITNVYRGLLLGTGPIIDPGFQGKLSIPIHNLTNNEYRFKASDAIISIEFTKISLTPEAIKTEVEKLRSSYPGQKSLEDKFWVKDFSDQKTVEEYIYKSLKNQPVDTVGNSIPAVSSIIEECSKKVNEESKKTESKLKRFEIIGILGVVLALATLALPTWIAFSDIQRERAEYNRSVSSYEEKIDNLEENLIELLISECRDGLDPFSSQKDRLPDDMKIKVATFENRLETLQERFGYYRMNPTTTYEVLLKDTKDLKADIEELDLSGNFGDLISSPYVDNPDAS